MPPERRAVAIIGMACQFPQARDLGAYWQNLLDGRVCFSDIPRERWNHELFYHPGARELDKTYARKVGLLGDEVWEFAALHHGMPPLRVKVTDPQHRLLLDAVRGALLDAGHERRPVPRRTTGVFIGASVSEHKDLQTARLRALQLADGQLGRPLDPAVAAAAVEDVEPVRAFSIAGNLLNMMAATVAQQFDLGGPAFTIDAACSSSLVATYEAVMYLRAGLCDVAIAGGVYLNLVPDNLVGFARIGALSRRDACRPFDADADGFVLGEGVGAVILKPLEAALRDGDRVYAVIRGAGINNDGRGEGPMTPRQGGQVDVLERAYADAGVTPDTVGFIEAHGTATGVGDVVEVAALREVFERGAAGPADVVLSSVKANLGHTMSAAGIAGLIKAALVLAERRIPPQAAFARPSPALGLRAPFRVTTTGEAWAAPAGRPRRAAVSSFGFGGTNCHLVLEEAPAEERPIAAGPHGFVISAPTPALLGAHLRELRAALTTGLAAGAGLAEVAATLAARGRERAAVGFVAATRAELMARLGEAEPVVASGEPGAGIWFAAEPVGGKVAFLFPGQGTQAVGSCRALYERFPRFRARVDALAGELVGALYPPAGTDPGVAAEALTRTEVCQPVLAALELALAELLGDHGVAPDVVLGHSLGELVAAGAAGLVGPEDTVRFVAQRGRIIAALPLGDTGAMAAIAAGRATVAAHVAAVPGVVVANVNHPGQVVASGTTAGIAALALRLAAAGIPARRLAVSHAFHAPLMEGAVEPLAEAVARLALAEPRVPVVSCIEPGFYPAAPGAVRALLVRHTTAAVDFVGGIEAAVAAGARIFVQVGGGSALLAMTRAILAGRPAAALVALAALDEDDGTRFVEALVELAVAGLPVDLRGLAKGAAATWLPACPLETETYRCVNRRSEGAGGALEVQERGVAVARAAAGQDHRNGNGVMEPTNGTEELGAEAGREAQTEPPAGGSVSVPGAGASAALVALFREQMAVLQAQVEIIRRQNATLAHGGVAGGMAATDATDGAGVAQGPGPAPPQVLPPTASGVGGLIPRRSDSDGRQAARRHEQLPPAVAGVGGLIPQRSDSNGSQAARQREQLSPTASGVGGLIPRGSDEDPAIEARLLDLVSAVSAFPRGRLGLDKKLSGELGFDSLMVVDLAGKLAEAFPGLGTLPKALFVNDPTLRKLAAHITRALRAGAPAAAPAAPRAAGEPDVGRYVPILNPAPLARPPAGAPVAAVGSIMLLPDRGGVAAAVTRLLDDAPVPDGAVLLDLRALDVTGADAAAIRATTLGAFRAVRGKRRPALVLLAHRGLAGAALPGLARALAREWPDSVVKAVAVEAMAGPADVAAMLLAELRSTDVTPEVVYLGAVRHLVALAPAPLAAGALPDGVAVVITGGTRGLGARLALELARRARARVALLGRSAPAPELLADLARAGGHATHHACDVTDAAAVHAAVAAARAAHGPFQLAIHAAGILADGPVETKTEADFARVLDTKVAGALALAAATATDPLRTLLLFSSWAGRFGNAAQTDYSAASAALGALAVELGDRRPAVRAVAVALPPWEGTAMVESIPAPVRAALRASGVTFLDDATGLELLVRELAAQGPSGEVVLGRDLPALERRDLLHLDVSIATLPWLDHHRVNGRPVLPLAAAASLALDAAGRVAGAPVELLNLELDGGVVLGVDGAGRPLAIRATSGRALAVELTTPDGLAYRAAAVPASGALPALMAPPAQTPPLPLSTFYARHTFHGPRLQGIVSIDGVSATHVAGTVRSAAAGELAGGFTIDPLLLDSCFQLAAYWAFTQRGRAGLPLGVTELRLLRPVPAGAELACLLVFAAEEGDLFTGDLDCRDARGELVLQLRGVRAELQAAAATPPPVAPAPPDDDIPAKYHRIEDFPEYLELRQKLDMAQAMGIGNPYFNVHEGVTAATSIIGGREVLSFSSYNYLGLSGEEAVTRAVAAAAGRYGTSVSASRIASGEKPLHRELEQGLARFLGTEDSIVMVGGHATNVGVIGHLFGPGDLIVHDSLAHDSILGGARLSGARRRPFPHNDADALDRILTDARRDFRKVLIAIEGTYSMDGDLPPLDEIIRVKRRHRAMLLVDEAHSLGVLGATGRGIGEHFGVDRGDVELWMGTLSKSLASCGGYLAGSRAAVEYLKYTMPAFVYSVGISPPNAAAALEALRQLEARPELVTTLRQRARLFLDLCRRRGIDTGMSEGTAVIPCIVGNSWDCLKLAQALGARGINVQPILYPAVEEHLARLRFFIIARHTEEELVHTADVLCEELLELNPAYLHHRRPLVPARAPAAAAL